MACINDDGADVAVSHIAAAGYGLGAAGSRGARVASVFARWMEDKWGQSTVGWEKIGMGWI
jgi:hypothetical protein